MLGWRKRLTTIEEQMKWAVLFAVVLSALTSARDIASMSDLRQMEFWVWSIGSQLTLFLYWAFFTPVVLFAMRWIRERGWNRAQAVALHAGLYVVLGSLFYAFVVLVNVKLWPYVGKTADWASFAMGQVFVAIFLNSALKYYVPILLGGTLYGYYHRMREEEVKAAQLKEQLSDAQFRLLKMQLHPHFLFNALHSISSLIYTDPARADRMITQLSDLLRLSLEATDVVMVPLREELQYVKKYLEIEHIRFSDRLQAKFSIEPDTLAVDVPNLILQPLVENAIKHGTAKQAGPGLIHVKAYKHRGGLVLAVEDNGPGFAKKQKSGIGTNNVGERLTRLYAHRARLSLSNLKPRGARQELFLPIDDISAFFEVSTTEGGQVAPAALSRGDIGVEGLGTAT